MKLRIAATSLFILFCVFSVQAREDLYDYSLDSPYATVITHLGFLQKGNYHPEIAAKTFSQAHRSKEEAIELAIRLKELLEKGGIDIDITQLPQDVNHIDPKAKYHRYQLTKLFPDIYLVKKGGQWLYSEETARFIADLAQENDHWGVEKLHSLLPSSFSTTFLGLYIWQYAMLAMLALLLTLVYTVIVVLVRKWLHRLLQRWSPQYMLSAEKPTSIAIVSLLLMLLLPVVQLPIMAEKVVLLLLQGVLAMSITVVCYRSINLIVSQISKRTSTEAGESNAQLVLLIKPFLKVFVVITGALLTLRSLNFDISALLAGVSIGGVGLALASQDTIKNLFGSLMIFIDQPFVVGDLIATEAIEGQVEEIGLRSTRIRTPQDSLMYVPNAKLANIHVDNYGLRTYRRFDTRIAIAYHTPPHLIETLVEGLRKIVKEHPYTRKDKQFVYLEDIRESTLQILLSVYFRANGRDKELQYRHEVLSDMIKLVEALDIRLAFPSQTLHMASFPERDHPLPVEHINLPQEGGQQ